MNGRVSVITISSRDFNRDAGGAKRAAAREPVFITDRGRVAHVLMSIDDYRRLSGKHTTIADLLALPGVGDIEVEFPKVNDAAIAADLD